MHPYTEFVDGWHIRAICEHLEAVTRGDILRLIINVPPRTCKSTIVSVIWPTWVWISYPHKQFLCSAHSFTISERDSDACRKLVSSKWFQSRWGNSFRMSKTQNTKGLFSNEVGGSRGIMSVDSSGTGANGDFLIGDDLNDTLSVHSDAVREKTNNWLRAVFLNRFNDRKTGAVIIIMQRCHESDVTGYLLSNFPKAYWTHLLLPYEYEPDRHCKTKVIDIFTKKSWEDPRKLKGELLWPNREGPKELEDRKRSLITEYDIAGQLQQKPSPGEGGIIKAKYFQIWKKPIRPKINYVIQSWDTALEAHDDRVNAYSACTTWGLFLDEKQIQNLVLLNMWRGRVEYPELRAMAQRLNNDYRDDGSVNITPDGKHSPSLVLVESKASGSPLIQDLRRAGVLAQGFNPTEYGDKLARVRLSTHIIEAGRLWLPASPPDYKKLVSWADVFLNLCKIFPNSDSRDVVDTMSQVILYLLRSNELKHPKDSEYVPSRGGPRESPYWPGFQ